MLAEHFGISFDKFGVPICDESFHKYVLELDDATKVLNDKNGNPVNFGDMPLDTFLEARHYVDTGNIKKILEMFFMLVNDSVNGYEWNEIK